MKNCKWLLLFGVFLSYFISPYFPVEWGWENSLLEWLQVAFLFLGFILNYTWWQEAKSGDNRSNARFLAWATPLWILMIFRELSWGRVFYPIAFDAVNGPTFMKTAQLPYGSLVHPLLAVIIVVWLYVFIKYSLYKIPYELLQEGRFPVAELVITILAFVAAALAEQKLHLQNMEEFDECLAYLGLILTAYCVKTALRIKRKNYKGSVQL